VNSDLPTDSNSKSLLFSIPNLSGSVSNLDSGDLLLEKLLLLI
jgi:hypothetical protein